MKVSAIADMCRSQIGLDPESIGKSTLSEAIQRRMQARGIVSLAQYEELLKSGDRAEMDELIELLVIPESWFYRGAVLLSHLARRLFAIRIARPDSPSFRCLSVPCAAGEEPFSLAIAFAEMGIPASAYEIDAVDLSLHNLERAARGEYSELAFRELPGSLADRYFQRVGDVRRISPALRASVHFQRANLVATDFLWSKQPYDLILCRNLLIYLTPSARQIALNHLDHLLKPEGWIGVGHAEPQLLFARGYETVDDPGLFLFRRAKLLPTGSVPIPPRLPSPRSIPEKGKSAERKSTPPAMPLSPPAPPPALSTHAVPVSIGERAWQLADSGAIDEAYEACLESLVTAPSARNYYLLGILLANRQNLPEAIVALEKALYLEPEHSGAMMQLLSLHRRLGNEQKAELLEQRLARVHRDHGT